MYNADVKERFIKESYNEGSEIAEACATLFRLTESYERNADIDLCAMSEEQLAPIFKRISTLRTGGSRLRVRILQNYAKWCLGHNINGANDIILGMKASSDDKMRSRMVSSPLKMQEYLNAAFDPEDAQYPHTDIVFRCAAWLIYGGMSLDDVPFVKSSDVNMGKRIVTYNGIEYPIYREGELSVGVCANFTQFWYVNPQYGIYANGAMRDRVIGNELVRGIQGVPKAQVIRCRLSDAGNKIEKEGRLKTRMNVYSIGLSGLFYRMLEREIAGVPVDFRDVADEFMSGKSYSYNSPGNNRARSMHRSKLAQKYRDDYSRWKEIFVK